MATIDPATGLPIKDTTTTAISTNQLSGATPINIVTPSNDISPYKTALASSISDLNNAVSTQQQAVDAQSKQALSESSAIANLQSQIGQKGADTLTQYQNTGVNDLANQLRDLNAQAQGLNLESQAIPLQEQNKAIGTGRVQGQVEAISSQRLRDNALKALSLAQQAAIATANYDKAKSLADQQIELKYSGLQAEIEAKKTNLSALDKYVLTPAQEKLKESQTRLLAKQEQEIADKKANEKSINDMLIQASQVAPPFVLNNAKLEQQKGASPTEIASILGEYAGDYWGTKVKIAQYNKIQADAEETRQKVSATGVGSTSTVNKEDQAKFVLDTINKAKQLANASGRSAGRRSFEKIAVGSTDYTNLEASIRTLKTNLLTLATDPNIKKFFGPQMTEADVKNMQAAATTLDTEGQSPQQLKDELVRAEKIFSKFVPGYVAPPAQTPDTWAIEVFKSLTNPTQGGTYGYIDNKK